MLSILLLPGCVAGGTQPVVTLAAVRAVAAAGTVHGLAVYRPAKSEVRPDDVTDWAGLLTALRDGDPALAGVWKKLDEKARRQVKDDEVLRLVNASPPDRAVLRAKGAVLGSLNNAALGDPGLFGDAVLAKHPAAGGPRSTPGRRPGPDTPEARRLNRRLLHSLLPDSVAEMPADFQAVRVRVRAGNPVVLVLSSHQPCRWEVRIDKGGAVGVVLCGYHAQEVVGVTCPVAYCAGYDRVGRRRESGTSILWRPGEDEPFAQAAAKLLGRKLHGFWGGEPPSGEVLDILPPR